MVKPELIEAGDFARIEELTRSAVNLMLGFEIRHIGIHGTNADEGPCNRKALFAAVRLAAQSRQWCVLCRQLR